jgi:hypothetical protein
VDIAYLSLGFLSFAAFVGFAAFCDYLKEN